MEEKIIDSMNDAALTPSNFITLMFERTDEDGILYIPGWHYDRPGWESNAPGSTDEEDSYRCKIDWNLYEYEKTLKEFEFIFSQIGKIAKRYDELFLSEQNIKSVLDEDAQKVFNTYFTPLDDDGFDHEKYEEIYDKLDTIEWVKGIAMRVAKGEKIDEYEKEILAEYVDVNVTREELEYKRKYIEHFHKEAEKRLGNNICAYDVYKRAWRVCRIISINAPQIIINNEARQFAAAFVLHKHGISRELVDNNIRLRLEKYEMMSDEELDELYRPKKSNTRKSLAPLFVFEVLSKKTNSKTHLHQQDILKELEKYPYEITLERKALSRIIHNLSDLGYGIYSDKSGVWKE